MKVIREESGQTLVLTVLCMTVLLGFLAFATDVGLLVYHRRAIQSAADCAAVAGADELAYAVTDGTTVQTVAKAAAVQNGFTDGSNGVTVTVNNGPANGPYKGNTSYVEVIIQQNEPTIFMNVFGRHSVAVAARAVAGNTANNGCVWTLGASGNDISQTGSGNLSIPTCNIYDDSSDSSDAMTNTGSGNITAKAIGIVGGYTNTGSGTITATPVTGMTYVNDPLSTLQPPTIPTSTGSGCQPAQNFVGSSTWSLAPGCYNGISITGSGSLTLGSGNYVINGNVSAIGSASLTLGAGNYIINGSLNDTGSGPLSLGNGNYTISGNFDPTGSGSVSLGSGLYIVEGNLSLTGSGPLNGTGVSFYTEGQTSVTGSSTVNLSAPTSGPENGMLFFQSRTDSQAMNITGSSNMNLSGIIYASDAKLSWTGSGSGTIYTDLVVNSLNLTGSETFQSYAVINTTTILAGRNSLVE